MTIEAIPIQGFLRGILRKLPGFLLRWYYTPQKLAGLIYVDMRPRHDSATVDLGQAASFSLWLQAINLSPFPVELDRASFRFWCGGSILNASILRRQIIVPGEIASLYMQETIPDGHADKMAELYKVNQVALDGNIEFNCKVRHFAKAVGHLNGIHLKVFNDQMRANKKVAVS